MRTDQDSIKTTLLQGYIAVTLLIKKTKTVQLINGKKIQN